MSYRLTFYYNYSMEVNILLRIVNILGWRVSQVACLATGTYYPVGWWHHLDIFYPNGISYEYKRNAHCCTNISDGKFDNGSTWLRTTLASCLTCLSFDTGQWVRAVRWLEWFLFLFLDSNGLYSHSYFLCLISTLYSFLNTLKEFCLLHPNLATIIYIGIVTSYA